MKPKQIALIGAGSMGRQWGGFFAAEGIPTVFYDEDRKIADEGVKFARKLARFRVREGLSSAGKARRGLKSLTVASSIADAVRQADYVQEQVYEDLDLKKQVFAEIEKFAPKEAILASTSGTLLPSQIQTALKRPERFLIVHPVPPVYLPSFLELVPHPRTAPEVMNEVKDFFEAHGKVTITLLKESEGHLYNRLLFLMLRESLDLVTRGVALPSEIDRMLCQWATRWTVGVSLFLQSALRGGSRQEGGIKECLENYSRTAPAVWRSAATWTGIPNDVKMKAAEEVEKMKAVRELPRSKVVLERDRRYLRALKTFKSKERDSFYV